MQKKPFKGYNGNNLYSNTMILDASLINDAADYGGMLYELKKLGIQDGSEFQIDNASDILMSRAIYKKRARLLKKFEVKVVN